MQAVIITQEREKEGGGERESELASTRVLVWVGKREA